MNEVDKIVSDIRDGISTAKSDVNAIRTNLDSINRKLDSMPTTRECWAFVFGFGMCGLLVISLALSTPPS